MRCFVRSTERYDEDASKMGCEMAIRRYRTRVERAENFQHPKEENYSNGYVCHRISKNNRMILKYHDFEINDGKFRCYLALRMMKHDAEYSRFCAKGTPEKELEQMTGLNNVNWESIVSEIKESLSENKEVKELPVLSEDEQAFLNQEKGITHDIFDTPIYESRKWVESMRDEKFGDSYKVAEAIEKRIYDTDNYEKDGFIRIRYNDKNDEILAYRAKESDARDGWFLIGLGSRKIVDQLHEETIKEFPDGLTFKKLASKSRRAYPLSMLDDKDFWAGMEKDKDSNFILSNEELDIVSKPLKYPSFISGRAGSGKSTVLQYLFAEFLLRYLQNEKVKLPVYLSYSSNLIENAKRLATSLFEKNHAYTKKMQDLRKEFSHDVQPLFSNTFFVFHDIVRKCIADKNSAILKTRFLSCNKISYAIFREMWENKFGKTPNAAKEYGPAISWHVIRTYIKGWDSESYCEPENYKEIGKNHKSVSDEVFVKIFEKVWKDWYKPEQESSGRWDEQDIVRYCLAPDDDSCETYVDESFSAILCDESQDFTRIETDFILRLSIFSNRKIHNVNTLNQLPFIFAGDEFQTLNPTGFSWDSLRSYFTEELVHGTGLEQKAGAVPDPISLTQNYRSTAKIVKLGNRIQLLRHTRCGSGSKIVPQVPYYVENGTGAIYCLPPENLLVWKKLAEMGVVLIVPCADGQSVRDYIEKSPIKGKIEFYEDGSPKNLTIYNPVQAKGLDYPCVAIYGFENPPELSLRTLREWLAQTKPEKDSETREIELKYFLSNVYVSATRAKNKLFIISEFSEKSFWAFAFSSGDGKLQRGIDDVEKKMLQKLSNQEDWAAEGNESMLGFVIEGSIEAITGENFVNTGEIAKITEERGMSLHDSGLLRQAAARYRERGQQNDVSRCEGFANFYEHNYTTAGEVFRTAKIYTESVRSYWLALSQTLDEKILLKVAQLKNYSERAEVSIAEHATVNQLPQALQTCLRDFTELLSILDGSANFNLQDEAHETRKAWEFSCGKLLQRVERLSASDKTSLGRLIEKCDMLETHGISLDKNKQAQLLFSVGNLSQAISIWDKIDILPRPVEYFRAKIETTQYPENVLYYEFSGSTDWKQKVVERYRSNKDVSIAENKIRKVIGNALLTYGNESEIYEFLPVLFDLSQRLDEYQRISLSAKKIAKLNELLEYVALARWTNLAQWERPERDYMDSDASAFVNMIDAVKFVRTEKFLEEVNDALRDSTLRDLIYRMRDVMERNFWQFRRTAWNFLLLIEIGIVMERRGYFLAAIRYYEWAVQQSDATDVKKALNMRWIACSERHADHLKNEDYRKEVNSKRKEFGIPDDYALPHEPKFDKWENLFANVLKLSDDVIKKEETSPDTEEILETEKSPKRKFPQNGKSISTTNDSKNRFLPPLHRKGFRTTNNTISAASENREFSPAKINPIPEQAKQPELSPMDLTPQVKPSLSTEKQPTLDKWFDYALCGYSFRFNPTKSELVISFQTETESYQTKIRQGKFPAEADFKLQNNVLVKENGDETPFLLCIENESICVSVRETGIQLTFPLKK